MNLASLSVLQMNIQGLLNKQSDIIDLLRHCTYLESIDIVFLAETWLKKDNEHRINIPGYTYYGEPRSNRKGGGVRFLVNKCLSFKKRPDLHTSDETVENCFIEIKGNKKGIILGVLYRPPNKNEKDFLKYYSKLIPRINRDKSLIIGLDYNLDLLKHHLHKGTQNFLELQMELKTFPCIMRPTRLTANSATLIDNILMSLDLYNKQKSCIVINDISDHLPCMSIVSDCISAADETPKILKRCINERSLNCLKNNLKNVDWDRIVCNHNLTDINNTMDKLTSCIMKELDKVSPEHYVPVSTK